MATLGFTDNDGVDLGTKYVTKEYVMDWYPDLVSNMLTPQLWTWGYNLYGGLGDGTTTSRSSPGTTAAGGTNWKQVAGGGRHTAAIKTDGTLWSWGLNAWGNLGDNTIVSKSSPVSIWGGGTTWKQVACGAGHSAAIKTNGTLWAWGYNFVAQLGDGTQANKSSPVQEISSSTNWKQVACGYYHTAAIKADGTLLTWGRNSFGQLGANTNIALFKSIPTQTAGGGTNWKQVSCGYGSTASIKTDGTLWAWGYNSSGGLGDNTTSNRSSPVQEISGSTNWKQVAAGRSHTAAIKIDGTLWTWGSNLSGELGDGTTTSRSSPGTIAGNGTNWKQISLGFSHNIAIKTDGTLWAWGNNSVGVLGDNTTVNKSSPVTVAGGGTNWKQVACGNSISANSHTVAISESEGW